MSKELNEINFTASITDASARDYEATPFVRDFILTAEKRLNSEGPPFMPPSGIFRAGWRAVGG